MGPKRSVKRSVLGLSGRSWEGVRAEKWPFLERERNLGKGSGRQVGGPEKWPGLNRESDLG